MGVFSTLSLFLSQARKQAESLVDACLVDVMMGPKAEAGSKSAWLTRLRAGELEQVKCERFKKKNVMIGR